MIYVLGPMLAGILLGEGAYRGKGYIVEKFGRRSLANMRAIRGNVDAIRADKNVQAFLWMVRKWESGQTEAAYTMMNGGQHFQAPPWKHPAKKFPGGKTTAAGAYQMVIATWAETAAEMALSDFSPVNQERAAVGRMAYRDILGDIQAGRIHAVLRGDHVGLEWEAMKKLKAAGRVADMVAEYRRRGGVVTDK